MWYHHIEHKQDVLGGRAVIKNTKISVDTILQKIDAGITINELMGAYPQLTRNDLLACISYGARHHTL